MCRPLSPILLMLLAACPLAGCRMRAPIHVWRPPAIASTVGKRVIVSTVSGPEKYAGEVKQKLLAMVPEDTGRATSFIDYQTLQDQSEIQLVSATDEEPNDLAIASVARKQGAEFLLRGEIIENGIEQRAPQPGAPAPEKSLTISWSLKSLFDGADGGGAPITIDTKRAVERYPDLSLAANQDDLLINAAVRESYRLFTPSVEREEVQIEIAYLLPGSAAVRQGNVAAMQGRWGEAEEIWSKVVDKHATNIAAIHNLAIASAAGQDFSKAKRLARRAIRLQPSGLHKKTLAWIETRQRDYHEAFGLPDPPEGWFVSNGTARTTVPGEPPPDLSAPSSPGKQVTRDESDPTNADPRATLRPAQRP